jgi:hypothetical protein
MDDAIALGDAGTLNGRGVPEIASLLIWQGEKRADNTTDWPCSAPTGHVAVVVGVVWSNNRTTASVLIAEQNIDDTSWQGRNYARSLPAVVREHEGKEALYITDPHLSKLDHENECKQEGLILGWKALPS